MSEMYVLEGHEPKPIADVQRWAREFENADRQVAVTKMGGQLVSTVFLGLDHSFGRGVPILFETMIFGGDNDQAQWRWPTWDVAEVGHEVICDDVWRAWYAHPEDAWWER